MRRSLVLQCAIALLTLAFLMPTAATAQMANTSQTSLTATPSLTMPAVADVGQISIVGGLDYSTHVEDPGFSVGLWYQIMEMIGANATFTYYFTEADFTIWTLDFMGRYAVVQSDDGPTIFVTGGINYLSWSFDFDNEFCGSFGISCGSTSASDVGLNAGGMIVWGMGAVDLFGKAHIVGLGGDSSGLAFGAGASLDI